MEQLADRINDKPAGVKQRSDLIPGLFFAAIVFILFFPYLVLGKTDIPFDLLKWSLPWGDGSFLDVQHHFSLDVPRHMFPWIRFIADSIHRFELPLWNPFNNFGSELISFTDPIFFDLFFIFYLISSHMIMDVIIAALKLWTAGMGMFFLMRYYGISVSGAILGGVTFMFNGSFVTLHSFYWALGAMIWLPYIILFLERSLKENPRVPNMVMAGLFLACSHLGGSIQNIIQIWVFLLIWMLSKTLVARSSHEKTGIDPFLILVIAYTVSLFLAAIGFVQFFNLMWQGPYNHIASNGLPLLQEWWSNIINRIQMIPFIISFAIPHFFGHDSILSPVSLVGGKWSDFLYGYTGFISFILAIAAGIFTREKEYRTFRNMGIIYLIFLILTPLIIFIYMRSLVLFTFCVAFLSGAGVDYFLKYHNREHLLQIARLVAIFCVFLVLGWVIIHYIIVAYQSEIATVVNSHIESINYDNFMFLKDFYKYRLVRTFSYYNFDNPKLIATVLIIFLFSASLFLYYFGYITKKATSVTIILLTCIDLSIFFFSYVPVLDMKEFNINTDDGSTDLLKNNLNLDRIMIINNSKDTFIFPYFSNLYFKFYSTSGWMEFSIPRDGLEELLSKEHPSFLNLANVKFMLTQSNQLDQNRFPLVHEGRIKIYQNPQVLPRAFTVGRVHIPKSEEETLKLLNSPDFDPKNTVYLSEVPNIDNLGPEAPEDVVVMEAYENRSVRIRTKNRSNRILVLSDTWHSGWTATIDGQPVPILKANAFFRAVALPSGEHIVEFRYRSVATEIGGWISLISLGCVLLFLRSSTRKKKNA